MADIKCTTAEEVYRALARGRIPAVYGSFTVELADDSSLVVEGGSPIIKLLGSHYPEIYVHGTSSPTIQVFGSNSPDIRTFDSSVTRIDAFDFSTLDISVGETSQATIISHDQSVTKVWADPLSKVTEKRGEDNAGARSISSSGVDKTPLSSLDALLSDEVF